MHSLNIISSVNSRNSKAQWQGKDINTNEHLYFYLKDPIFANDFFKGKYPVKTTENDDRMDVLIEYKTSKITKKTEHNAKKVFKFNDAEIAEIPSDLSFENV